MTLITSPVVTQTIGCAIQVHRALGPGLFESVYERCFAHEVEKAGLSFLRQVRMPLRYDGLEFECAFRADFIVADEVLVELKATEQLLAVHTAQVRTYLRCAGLAKGLLLNFNAPTLTIKSVILSNAVSMDVATGTVARRNQ